MFILGDTNAYVTFAELFQPICNSICCGSDCGQCLWQMSPRGARVKCHGHRRSGLGVSNSRESWLARRRGYQSIVMSEVAAKFALIVASCLTRDDATASQWQRTPDISTHCVDLFINSLFSFNRRPVHLGRISGRNKHILVYHVSTQRSSSPAVGRVSFRAGSGNNL